MKNAQINLINYITALTNFIYKIYPVLSPYLEIAFTAFVGYWFFLKQFLQQKKEERKTQVVLQKDQLHKEIFDQIAVKIENSIKH